MFKWYRGERARRALAAANKLLLPHNCIATDVAPHSVNSEGDNRVYGPAFIVTFPEGTTTTQAGEITTRFINTSPKHLEFTRILMEITPKKSPEQD